MNEFTAIKEKLERPMGWLSLLMALRYNRYTILRALRIAERFDFDQAHAGEMRRIRGELDYRAGG